MWSTLIGEPNPRAVHRMAPPRRGHFIEHFFRSIGADGFGFRLLVCAPESEDRRKRGQISQHYTQLRADGFRAKNMAGA